MQRTIAVVITLLLATQASGHPGRTDANGCHTDHTVGTDHCHSGGAGDVDAGTVVVVVLSALLVAGIIVGVYHAAKTPSGPDSGYKRRYCQTPADCDSGYACTPRGVCAPSCATADDCEGNAYCDQGECRPAPSSTQGIRVGPMGIGFGLAW